MPKILINEFDNTSYYNREINNDNIVVIFAPSTSAAVRSQSVDKPTLCRNLKTFYNNFGYQADGGIITDSSTGKSMYNTSSRNSVEWEYAVNLIRVGFPVMYIAYSEDAVIPDILKELNDKINYKIKFIVGKNLVDNTNVHPTGSADKTAYQDLLGLIDDRAAYGGRGDCEAFIDIDNATNDTIAADAARYEGSSYCAIAYPSGKFTSPVSGVQLTMPASFWMLKTMAEGVQKGNPIYSIWAGARRGVISGVDEFTHTVTPQLMDEFTNKVNIIPLMNVPPYGNLIYGNNTRLHPGAAASVTKKVSCIEYIPKTDNSIVKLELDSNFVGLEGALIDYQTSDGTVVETILSGEGEESTNEDTTSWSLTSDEDGESGLVSVVVTSNGVITVTVPTNCKIINGSINLIKNITVDEVVASTRRSALDHLNVRLTANEIKSHIYEICLGLNFEPNDFVTWNEFQLKLSRKLDAMKSARAINDYLIMMSDTISGKSDSSIDEYTVPGIVKVDITRAAENFRIEFELTPTGAIISEDSL